MPRFKSLLSLLIMVVAVCALGSPSFAKPAAKKCDFNGNYSFFFWDPAFSFVGGVGYFSVQLDPATKCRSGMVLPGGILNCNIGFEGQTGIFEDFIEGGAVFLESDGEGTMLLETNSSEGICGIGADAIELDVSVVLGGKSVLFNSDGEEFASSGLVPQAGYVATLTGRADRCFAGQISGCYDVRFWSGVSRLVDGPINSAITPDAEPNFGSVGDCTICVNGAGAVTGGTCRCSGNTLPTDFNQTIPLNGFETETLSEIEGGGYTLGENCQSSTGYLWFVTSSDEICNVASYMAFDFAVAQQGQEIMGACDTAPNILNNTSEDNAGVIGCAFEGWLQ
ncbi:MAG TPA: hypothetical protein VMB26_03745 [Candidatus Binataceae bacterium]|nr:hypothetical protein [Candidatus Binataceae bacterium]